ncbi:signal peptidase I [Dubosiella muris]|mgnify:CR=1 FL=1|uniref:Signal peptidase I n=1 Tax=Dubosiella muris TaxID=3038133 RepID=A0AC61R7I9_9FIRM|nr:signal peptidase I [Dubosiella muris]TGY65913.1 signal peptidase I [Dubosiella muris]
MRKKERENKRLDMPTRAELEKERDRVRHNRQYRQTLRSTMGVLVVVAALAILAATLWLPVLRIYGTSMTPNLTAGDIVLSVKGSDFKTGDVIAFYYNNKILVKRVIAGPGDWVYIDDDGNVFVNGEEIDEPYVQEKALGETDLEYPYQVPEKRWFVMGDHRSVSLDSRTRAIGPIAEEMIVGKLEGRIWPLNKIGKI